jgi:formylglycine-generating enzyme required for sulfatase activity
VQDNRDRPLARQQLAYRAERWQRAPRLTRWWHLAFAGGWWGMRRLGVGPNSVEGRFLAASRRASVVAALLVVFPVVALVESASWAAANNLPFVYAFAQLKWYAGVGPIPEVTSLPPGRFTMGCKPGRDDVYGASCDEQVLFTALPAVEVRLSNPCAIGKYEVTFEQYDYFVWSTGGKGFGGGSYPSDEGWGRGDRPVINVGWNDAQGYVRWLSGKTGQPWRLPSDKEWEYAARGGNDETAFWWGNDAGEGRANCDGCDPRYGGKRTAPVGSYECNKYGVCDTVGNVWEWVQDAAKLDASPSRVLRGGSWDFGPWFSRAASREVFDPDHRFGSFGFRVCRGSPIE